MSASDRPTASAGATSGGKSVRFPGKNAGLESVQVWEYDAGTSRRSRDVASETVQALTAPEDFPPIDAAIVSGDRVAIALDPNVPNIEALITGTLQTISRTPADAVENVVWEEATDETMQRIRDAAGDCPVTRHTSGVRESLCYLCADVDAEPIYLNRSLVEADFVLPIVAVRPSNLARRGDLTGIFPSLCDSSTRLRFAAKIREGRASDPAMKSGHSIAEEVPWLLGVQLILNVTANSQGLAGEIHAGTLEAMAKRITPTLRRPDPVPPPASLVIAALDGDQQQQTWENAARAADAAIAYAQPEATIVIWSSVDEPPGGALLALDVEDSLDSIDETPATREEDEFPEWDRFADLAGRLKEVTGRHRLLLYSRIDPELIEPLGIGVIASAQELANLSRGFESCGVLRAASFAGGH